LGLVRRLIVALLNGANFLMVNSEFTRRQYLARGVRADQTFVRIHPGVDLKRFLPNLDASPIVRRHGLAGRPLILTVGRLVEWKGQDMVMRALPYVLQAVPTAAYVVVGEGPYRKPLERLVAELKLHDHVIFAGFVPAEELAMYYRAADVTVLVSREICPGMPIEGFGMVYLEANAAGRPVIGSRMGGVTEAILEGVTGLLVNPNDEKEIAAAIMRLLTDRVLAEHMGIQGRARAARELSWQTQAAGLRRQLQMRAGARLAA
jgi:phosphatidylinositol alpha-1,6-mannosyltransferase